MGDAAALRARLVHRFADPDTPLDEAEFDDLALQVFARNYDAVPAYAAYCRARGRTPDSVVGWRQIPAVPTAAFKELALHARDMPVARTFRTSGTSRGRERRGEHHVADLDLYRASLRPAFRAFLLPDDARPRFLSLMPPAAVLPDSSLAFMISDVLTTFGTAGSAAFADADGIDFDALSGAVEEAAREDVPVLLLGTSAAFIHWLDRLAEGDRRLATPPGSRLMDTGGYKGKGRAVEPETLRRAYRDRLGIPAHACVNEYGMTELLSQRYDDGLRRHVRTGHDPAAEGPGEAPDPVRKAGPPWLRTVAVDAETLAPLPDGETGLLRHVDLANLDSVAAVQTEDVGRVDPHGGLFLEGRARGATPRGCSIAMDLLLEEAP